MCAVRDSLGADSQGPRNRIQQFYLTNFGSEGSEFFKLLPTQGDRDAYASLIHEPVATVPESQFRKSYDFFRRRLRDTTDEGEKIDPKRILEIVEKRLMVVMINLSDTDDPHLIFESLNFKGSPLEQADLVRNFFLMRFPVTDQQGVYDGLWLPMQNRLGPGLTEFMRHFLGAEGEEIRKGDVYAAIKRLVPDSDSASVRLLLTRMERLSGLYGRVSGVAAEPHPELVLYLDHFRRLDFGSVYPLLLGLYEDYSEGQFALGGVHRQHGNSALVHFASHGCGRAIEFSVRPLHIALQNQASDGDAFSLAFGLARARRQEPKMARGCGVRGRLGAVHFVWKSGVPGDSRMSRTVVRSS